jgi:prevent-host-death family protein
MITVSVTEARENLSDLLGKVQHGQEDVLIQRHGKTVAVMISVEAMAHYEALEDAELGKMGEAAYAEYLADPSKAKTLEEYLAEDSVDSAVE